MTLDPAACLLLCWTNYTISEHRPKNEVSRVSLESPIESLPPCCFMKSSYEWNACFSTHSEKWSANIYISQWLITVRPLDKETEKETEKTFKDADYPTKRGENIPMAMG
jgi:hypothetical protein